MQFKVLTNEENRRLDNFLRKKFEKTSLSLIYKLIRTHKVSVNKQTVLDPKYKVVVGDIINVNNRDIALNAKEKNPIKLKPADIKEFEIIFENQHIIIINKPPFTSVHGFANCLDNQVKHYLINKQNDSYSTHIHRLDKDTTGCIIYAKSLAVAKYLTQAIDDIKKVYICITAKPFAKKNFVQDGYLALADGAVKTSSSQEGKLFRQKIQLLGKISDSMFLQKITLLSGRKHQIRFGCSLLNNPIIGEKVYITANQKQNMQKYLYLHAYSVVLSSQICEDLELKDAVYIASLPKYWADLFKKNKFIFKEIQLL